MAAVLIRKQDEAENEEEARKETSAPLPILRRHRLSCGYAADATWS
jgi:hypothetical protein